MTLQAPDAEREAAFSTYVMPEVDVMFRVAMSLTRKKADAEDLVQDSLIRAYRAIDRFDGRHPRAWLLTILRNTHINRNRRRRPELLHDPDTEMDRLATTSAGDEYDPEALVVSPVFDNAVVRALEDLPERFRSAVELVDLAGLSYQDAADQLGVPVGTVMSRLHRARRRMRTQLEAAGYGTREFE
jgi:RNA polymerase sigma-70 factor (ECF subfamily)